MRGAKYKDRVDARELVEKCDENCQQDRRLKPLGEDRAACQAFFRLGGLGNALSGGGNVFGRFFRIDLGEHRFAFLAPPLEPNQPPRAFGDAQGGDRVGQRGNRLDAEHPTPVVLADTFQ